MAEYDLDGEERTIKEMNPDEMFQEVLGNRPNPPSCHEETDLESVELRAYKQEVARVPGLNRSLDRLRSEKKHLI